MPDIFLIAYYIKFSANMEPYPMTENQKQPPIENYFLAGLYNTAPVIFKSFLCWL